MPKIVKDLSEAKEKGLIGTPQSNAMSSDIGKIISDVKRIIDGIKELKSLSPQPKAQQENNPLPQMNFNETKTEINNKIPVAVIKFNEEKFNEFLDNLLSNPNLKAELTLGEIKDKWSLIKEMIKPELKNAINQIVKAEMEYR